MHLLIRIVDKVVDRIQNRKGWSPGCQHSDMINFNHYIKNRTPKIYYITKFKTWTTAKDTLFQQKMNSLKYRLGSRGCRVLINNSLPLHRSSALLINGLVPVVSWHCMLVFNLHIFWEFPIIFQEFSFHKEWVQRVGCRGQK